MKRPSSFCFAVLILPCLIGKAALSPANAAQPPQTTTKAAPIAVAPGVTDWTNLKASYDYDALKTVKVTAEERPDDSLHIEHLTFTDAKGQTVTGLFVRPKAEGVYPVSLVLHGLGSSKEGTIDFLGKTLAAKGVACLALDAPRHGERKPKETEKSPGGAAFLTVVHDGVLDYRQAIGYLTQRKDVDGKRLGLIGNSMGAMMGAILTAVDDRITAGAFCVGGDPIVGMLPNVPAEAQTLAASASPSLYIGHISPRPVFLINALQDETMSKPAAKRFEEAAREPKTSVWVTSGHVLPPNERQKAIDWLAERLNASKGRR